MQKPIGSVDAISVLVSQSDLTFFSLLPIVTRNSGACFQFL